MEDIAGLSAVAVQVPSEHTSPAPIISRVWKQGNENRGTEAPVEEAEKKKA